MFDIKNKKITIIGGKRSGLALAKLIKKKGGVARISEQAAEPSMDDELIAWIKKNRLDAEFGGHTRPFIEKSDVVVLSPGVRLDAQPVQWALAKGILVLGEIEFAYQFCEKPVIAVTGSNGKTTTVNLITQVIKQAGLRPCLCGNVGAAFSNFVLDLDKVDYVVLEVSSFQLESLLGPDSKYRKKNKSGLTVEGFKPLVGVILNFSQNHLDRHKDLREYFDAKTRLFLNQTKKEYAVLNFNDAWLKKLEGTIKSKIVYFDSPSQRGKIKIKNPNQLAVLAVTRILNIPTEKCLKVVTAFKGVEHRLEFVRVLDGIDFINDSKATTAEASRWALNNIEKPILMICGGRDKHIDFSVLKGLVHDKVRKMFLIGEAKDKLKNTFEDTTALKECGSLEEAVRSARKEAKAGECVVLSPMCTSFDMFRDYEHRGKVFKEIVNNLS